MYVTASAWGAKRSFEVSEHSCATSSQSKTFALKLEAKARAHRVEGWEYISVRRIAIRENGRGVGIPFRAKKGNKLIDFN